MISATISPCAIARCASIGSPVTSPIAQTLRIEVAERSSMRRNGPAIVEVERLEPEAARARAPSDRDQNLVGRDASSRPRPRRRPAGRRWRIPEPSRRASSDPEVGEAPRDRLGQVLVVERQDARQRLDDRDFAPSLAKAMPSSMPI